MSELTVNTLLEEAKIQRVLILYATALDACEWDRLDNVFATDAVAHFQGIGEFKGRKAIVDLIKSVLGHAAATQHMLSNFRIEANGDTATAQCYLRAIHTGKGDFEGQRMTVWGEYRDKLHLTSEGWRITYRELAGIHAEGDIGMAIISNS